MSPARESKRPVRDLSLSVFFPCYNEAANIGALVEKTISVLADLVADWEIIVVDDGSSDGTAGIVEALSATEPRIRVVRHGRNRGYGAALRSGFAAARKDYVFYTDGDGQFDMGEIPRILPLLARYDIVSCYRLDRKDSLMRKLNALAWTTLVNMLFRIGLRDIDGAFKFYPKPFIDSIEMHSTGALIDTEMLAKARNMGLKIGQTGVHHYPRLAGEQSGANIRVILRAFKELFKLRRRIKNEGRQSEA